MAGIDHTVSLLQTGSSPAAAYYLMQSPAFSPPLGRPWSLLFDRAKGKTPIHVFVEQVKVRRSKKKWRLIESHLGSSFFGIPYEKQ